MLIIMCMCMACQQPLLLLLLHHHHLLHDVCRVPLLLLLLSLPLLRNSYCYTSCACERLVLMTTIENIARSHLRLSRDCHVECCRAKLDGHLVRLRKRRRRRRRRREEVEAATAEEVGQGGQVSLFWPSTHPHTHTQLRILAHTLSLAHTHITHAQVPARSPTPTNSLQTSCRAGASLAYRLMRFSLKKHVQASKS